ncbi:MAG: DUF177 domain-containing protein [Candidatus Zapsychrus exili]|nr:DUF177 domain-containing protein [Candidatus Zapsychrus exili]
MIINISEVKSEGIEVTDEIDDSSLGILEEESIHCPEPLKINAKINLADNIFLVKAKVEGKYSSFCFRCMEPVESVLDKEFSLDFEIEDKVDHIDISDDIRQEILLSLPNKILCDSDCLGICLDCKQNLNKEKCKCNKQ